MKCNNLNSSFVSQNDRFGNIVSTSCTRQRKRVHKKKIQNLNTVFDGSLVGSKEWLENEPTHFQITVNPSSTIWWDDGGRSFNNKMEPKSDHLVLMTL